MAQVHAPRSVWITGTGAVSCLGQSVGELWQNLRANKTGIHEGVGRIALDATTAGIKTQNRALQLAQVAIQEAMKQAGWTKLNADDGIILATTTGQILLWDQALVQRTVDPSAADHFRQAFVHQPLGELLRAVQVELNHAGPSSLLTSACSASTQALALAAMWIRQARVKRCMVVGVEVLCDLTLEGFRSLQLLSQTSSRPFDVKRQGINLSEGAAVICLDSDSTNALAELSGFGMSSDGHHMTGPHPEGEGSLRAMGDALKVAGILPADISWVHAHGTGSKQNDLSEGLAVCRLFGERQPYISSTKWSHGHALAASGTLEVALVVKALAEQIVLHTRGMEVPDPQMPVNHPLQDRSVSLKHVLKSTLGFGGSNAALVISHVNARAR